MDSLNEDVNVPKQRHGCVTTWLVFVIIINSLFAFVYLFANEFIINSLPNDVSTTMILLLGILCIANAIFAVMLFQWKKIGFWGFVASSIFVLIINLSIGIGIGQSVAGLLGIAIYYGVLQIKRDNVSAWDNLE
jgi:hypothetical protein